MKQLLSLSKDFILEAKFRCDQVKGENNMMKPDFVDDKKDKAHGKNIVESITILVPDYDKDGYPRSKYIVVGITKSDILALVEKIKEIESVRLTGHPGEDMPF